MISAGLTALADHKKLNYQDMTFLMPARNQKPMLANMFIRRKYYLRAKFLPIEEGKFPEGKQRLIK